MGGRGKSEIGEAKLQEDPQTTCVSSVVREDSGCRIVRRDSTAGAPVADLPEHVRSVVEGLRKKQK